MVCFFNFADGKFFSLLRPGEALALTRDDVVLPNSITLGSPFAVLRLVKPKNARQMGNQQYVELRHPDAVNWLGWLLSTTSCTKQNVLWTFSAQKFRRLFAQISEKLGVKHLRFSPASLRAGGATWLLDSGMDVARIRFLGRWAHLRSLEHYLQVARAQQIALTLSASTSDALKTLLSRHMFMLTLPEFFAAQVSPENRLNSPLIEAESKGDVIAAVRTWGELAQAIPQSGSGRRKLKRSPLSGRRMGRLEESSKKLQE